VRADKAETLRREALIILARKRVGVSLSDKRAEDLLRSGSSVAAALSEVARECKGPRQGLETPPIRGSFDWPQLEPNARGRRPGEPFVDGLQREISPARRRAVLNLVWRWLTRILSWLLALLSAH
jgi:hypothetical protein